MQKNTVKVLLWRPKSCTKSTGNALYYRIENLKQDAHALVFTINPHIPLSGDSGSGVGKDIYDHTSKAINNVNKQPRSIRDDSDVGTSK